MVLLKPNRMFAGGNESHTATATTEFWNGVSGRRCVVELQYSKGTRFLSTCWNYLQLHPPSCYAFHLWVFTLRSRISSKYVGKACKGTTSRVLSNQDIVAGKLASMWVKARSVLRLGREPFIDSRHNRDGRVGPSVLLRKRAPVPGRLSKPLGDLFTGSGGWVKNFSESGRDCSSTGVFQVGEWTSTKVEAPEENNSCATTSVRPKTVF